MEDPSRTRLVMMNYNYTNSTLFELKNDALRYTWASWYIFVVLGSILGDSTILYASIKYRVFNLHAVTVTLMQHTAACDLLLSIVLVLPNAVSTIIGGQGWKLGTFCNYSRVYVMYYSYPVAAYLISALTTFKVLLLKYPLRASTWSYRHAYKICAVIWTVSLYNPVSFLIVDKSDLYYDARIYSYDYGFSSDIWHFLAPIGSFIMLLTPNIVTIVATVILVVTAIKSARTLQRTLKWQGILMVILSALVYTVSVFPIIVYKRKFACNIPLRITESCLLN